MTIEKREITIPSWVVTAVVSIAITVIGYTIGSARVEAQTTTEVGFIQKEVKDLDRVKASKESVENLESILLRVESKLDRHIELQINKK